MKILQLIHLKQAKAKKLLWLQGRKPQIFPPIGWLLLALCLTAGGFSTAAKASSSSVSANLMNPTEKTVSQITCDGLMADIKEEQRINGNKSGNTGMKAVEDDTQETNAPENNGQETEDSESEEQETEDSEQKEGEEQTSTKSDGSDKKGKWKIKNKKVFYYENGKKVTGLKKIETKYYYFDSKGVQHTGWQKYKKSYYFFYISNGKKGFMAKSKKVNGILLKKSGKAKLTANSKAKLNVLIKANKIVEKATKPYMKKSEKLKKTFSYLIKHYKYRGSPIFIHSSHWELHYALQMFDEGHGSCYAYGAAFAFLANAVGYDHCYAISSGGHGWAEVNGRVYDPSWCLVDKSHSYYALNYNLSGVAGRPNYKIARKYVIKI